ncbi:MAG: ferritin family protein, partial [Chloroflexi bacterium]|nr:ferritin family protein [Chloroflexota bacterium]
MTTRLTVQSVLEKAIEKEIEAQHLYRDLSQKMTDAAAKDAFSQLSREEKGHEELLRKYLRGEIGVGGLKKDSVLDYKIAEYLDQPEITPAMALKDTFLLAANREKASHEFYPKLAAVHPSGGVKKLLEQLAAQ